MWSNLVLQAGASLKLAPKLLNLEKYTREMRRSYDTLVYNIY